MIITVMINRPCALSGYSSEHHYPLLQSIYCSFISDNLVWKDWCGVQHQA
jgi:hypothetical protein